MYDYERELEEEYHRQENLFWPIDIVPFWDQRHLIEGFLPETGLVILAGDPKSGKTALANAIALAVAKGKPFDASRLFSCTTALGGTPGHASKTTSFLPNLFDFRPPKCLKGVDSESGTSLDPCVLRRFARNTGQAHNK